MFRHETVIQVTGDPESCSEFHHELVPHISPFSSHNGSLHFPAHNHTDQQINYPNPNQENNYYSQENNYHSPDHIHNQDSPYQTTFITFQPNCAKQTSPTLSNKGLELRVVSLPGSPAHHDMDEGIESEDGKQTTIKLCVASGFQFDQ